jgi:hypothetical protein
MKSQKQLNEKAQQIAENILESEGKVTAFEVLMRMQLLHDTHVKMWRRQANDHYRFLEHCMQSTRERRANVLKHLENWGSEKKLDCTAEEFYPASREAAGELQITEDGSRKLERLYRLCLVKPGLTERKRKTIEKKITKRPDLLVFVSFREDCCAECGDDIGKGQFIFLSGPDTLCLSCADLDHLAFLPSGNVAMTRRARKYSPLSAIVLEHNRRRHRQQRIGLLVTEDALVKAEEECLADADARERRRQRDVERRSREDKEYTAAMAAEIRRLFPKCPKTEAEQIARHACRRGSGRVGRAAFARDFDPRAVELAVRAHIRHAHTNYDTLLYTIGDREEARRRVGDKVDQIAARWQNA